MKANIRNLSLDEISQILIAQGESKFRAKQVYEWIWQKSATDFSDMTNLSKDLRDKLSEGFEFKEISEHMIQKSSDGTIKIGFKTFDNRDIEGVMIPMEERMTACVSSQVGCSLACAFCATGFLKRERNLDFYEIYDQVVSLNKMALAEYGKPLSNIVYMGMGEPLLNYENVVRSIRMINSPIGLQMSAKRITVSTSGIVRGIKKLADEGLNINLALSLHAPNNEKRNEIMDINNSNPIEELIPAMNYFFEKTGNRITFEYILFDKFNDTMQDARELAVLCKKVPCFVNLIEYNKVEGVEYSKSKNENRDAFFHYLRENGIPSVVRRSRGKDIDAACGQLANKIKDL
ncbi:MAG: 23S rRNA (adenine(2503)-C(2))-methyltransferase RlmN [Bacteroidetes bacterium]|nr:23S rRNA (adenine(2503)-C(2))-methyltransferase RlmN [Bacteroidota bacterium]